VARDTRTRRQKLQDVIRLGATDEEKDNARRLLERLGPEPANEPYKTPRRPDFTGPIYSHRQAQRDASYARYAEFGADDWARQPRRPPAGYPDYSGLSFAELMQRMREAMGDFDRTVNETMRERAARADFNMDGATGFSRPEDCAGKHDYVVIGTSMFHTDIKRCLRCGVFDPPRRNPNGAREQGPR
jgi:hypothetical protein